jgi:biopolymer transport protein ExbB
MKTLRIITLGTLLALSGPVVAEAPAAPAMPAMETTLPSTSDATAAPSDSSQAGTETLGSVPVDATPVAGTLDNATAVVDDAVKTVSNPYGLEALWAQGDFIAKGTLIIMVVMSAFTWYIIFTKLWEQTRLLRQARQSIVVWQATSLAEGSQQLPDDSIFKALINDGLNAVKHHDGKLTDQIDQQEWVSMTVQRSVDHINSDLQTGISFLATVGSTSPFIGLFGTVWGIYHALIAIGVSGQASIDKVAGPVGEALIMTAIGLAVAVPAVLGYNWLVRRNKLAMESVRNFAADVQAVLAVGARVASAAK